MGGENDGAGAAAQKQQAQDEQAQAAVTAGAEVGADVGGNAGAAGGSGAGADGAGGDATVRAQQDYRKALKERDAKIKALEGEIAEAAKTAEGAEKLRAEMDELKRASEEQHVGFELQLAGARNVKAARALLPDHDNDIEKLRSAEPWLFGAAAAAAPTGATGLPNAGAATDESATLKRWKRIAGIEDEKE